MQWKGPKLANIFAIEILKSRKIVKETGEEIEEKKC